LEKVTQLSEIINVKAVALGISHMLLFELMFFRG